MLAHQLASKLFGEVVRGDVRITLLSDSPEHCYEPAFMCVAFGAFFRDELARDERSLLRPEIAFVVDRATHFDFAAQRVHATSGKCYGYDHLVIATGCVPSPERIEGLAEAGIISTRTSPRAGSPNGSRQSSAAPCSSPSRFRRCTTCRISAASRRSRPR